MLTDTFFYEYGNNRVQELHKQAQDMRTIDAAGKNNSQKKKYAFDSSVNASEKDRLGFQAGRRKPAVFWRLASLFSMIARNIF